MILLDTNVISELMRPSPAPVVMAWFGDQNTALLYFNAVSEAELRTGIAILPEGKRRDRLVSALDGILEHEFAGRVLSFDSVAARHYAAIAATSRSAGRPITTADCQIAAIARAQRAAVATRNTADFENCGIDVVDPWS